MEVFCGCKLCRSSTFYGSIAALGFPIGHKKCLCVTMNHTDVWPVARHLLHINETRKGNWNLYEAIKFLSYC
jgi:hypothetical protein